MRPSAQPARSTSRALTEALVQLGPWVGEQKATAERLTWSLVLRHPIASDLELAVEVTRLARFLSATDLDGLEVDLSGLDEVSRQILDALLFDLHDELRARYLWALPLAS